MPALPIITAAATVAGVASSISAQRKAMSAQKDALAKQRELAANFKYEPVNIEALKQQAHDQAVLNATQSLALERELSPDVAATRQAVAERVRSDLALGGKLSPDIANQVARAARTSGALSGAPAGPLTAAQIGTTAEALKQQRLANAGGLLTANPLKPTGLDPGALASLIVSQNAAQNKFNAQKMGIDSSLIQSGAEVAGTGAATQNSINSQMLNAIPGLIGGLGGIAGLFSGGGTSTPGMGLLDSYKPLANAEAFSTPNIPAAVTPTLENYSFGGSGSMLPSTLTSTPSSFVPSYNALSGVKGFGFTG